MKRLLLPSISATVVVGMPDGIAESERLEQSTVTTMAPCFWHAQSAEEPSGLQATLPSEKPDTLDAQRIVCGIPGVAASASQPMAARRQRAGVRMPTVDSKWLPRSSFSFIAIFLFFFSTLWLQIQLDQLVAHGRRSQHTCYA